MKKTFFNQSVFMDFRDNIDDISRSTGELETRENRTMFIPVCAGGLLWDVGANVGLFSVRAAVNGQPCIAFDFSKRAVQLLKKTAAKNRLSITVVNQAFTATTKQYNPATTSGPQNRVDFLEAGGTASVTYKEAEQLYGTPALIKMDIEGGEKEFFDSRDFKEWFCEKKIFWLVELHPTILGYAPKWDDVPMCEIDSHHHLYCSDSEKMSVLVKNMGGM
ncbi:MAG: FkbM family methyltransferase [Kiritimatiellales bacterium]